MSENLFPAGTFAPDPRPAPVPRMLAAQYALDLKLLLRNGEQLLLTMFIPITLLIGLTLLGAEVHLIAPHTLMPPGIADLVRPPGRVFVHHDLDAVLALHVASGIPAGQVGIIDGPNSAAVDSFKATIIGKGGHGAYPHQTVDPIFILAQVINAIHGGRARRINPTRPAVISVGAVHTGSANNIIPDTVELTGMVRALDEEMRKDILRRIRHTAKSIAESAGGSADVVVTSNYDVTNNDERLGDLVARSLKSTLGESNVFVNPKVTVSEDFSAYQKEIPGFLDRKSVV